ncbi:MAG: hypothetical protein ACKVHE_15215 [Planctomycetales bacterium]
MSKFLAGMVMSVQERQAGSGTHREPLNQQAGTDRPIGVGECVRL